MKKNYPKGRSIALITAIYVLAGVAGVLFFNQLTALSVAPLWALLWADVLATVIVWLFGLLYENVSVYDPYWSVFPPVVFLLWAFYTHTWSVPMILLLVATWYWGWRLTRNWVLTFKGIGHEDWRYSQYRSKHPLLFHLINLFGLNMMPTLVVFMAMLPALMLYNTSITANLLTWLGFLICLAAPTIQLIADKQIHNFRATHPGQYCNVGLWKHGRHPNYFGEILFWWGMWVMYASLTGFDWLICGPVVMTALFVCISIPLMEKRQLKNKPGYAEYRKQTRMFI